MEDDTYSCARVINRWQYPAQRQHYLKYFDQTVDHHLQALNFKEYKYWNRRKCPSPTYRRKILNAKAIDLYN